MLKTSRWFLALVGSGLAAACGDSKSPSEPSVGPSLDLAAAIAQMNSTTVGGFSGSPLLAAVPVSVVAPAVVPSSCAFNPSVQGFVCPAATSNGLTFSVSFFLADAAGTPQSQLDGKSTASIRTVVDAKGTFTLSSVGGIGAASVLIDDHSDMTMSGLLSTVRTLNGTSRSHEIITSPSPSVPKTTVDVASTTSNVAIPASGTDGAQWPKSGTIAADINAKTELAGTATLSTSLHSLITFNGTSTVTIVTTVGGATSTCRIDLSGKTAPSC